MCSAAGLACISLELLPDTSARAAHSHMSRRLQAGGLRERLASCSRSAAQTILLILEHLSLPRSGHLPSQPSWMAHTPMVSPTVPVVSSTLTSIISHQTHPAGSHQPLCVGLQQSAALPQSCRKEWPGLEN